MGLFSAHVCGQTNHRFEPRHNTCAPALSMDDLEKLIQNMGSYPDYDEVRSLLNDSRPQIYVCDVCVRCGEVRKAA